MRLEKLSCRCKDCGKHFEVTKSCTRWDYNNSGFLGWLFPNKKKTEKEDGLSELMPHCPACGSRNFDSHKSV